MSSIAIPSYKDTHELRVRRDGLNRLFLLIIGLLVAILALELLFHFAIGPKLLIERVQISTDGGIPLAQSEILKAAGLDQPVSYFALSAAEVKARLEAYPLIQSATVHKVFPNSLQITIHERTPFAVAFVDSPSGSVPIAFDAQGVVVQVGAGIKLGDLPVISGVSVPAIQVGMHLPKELVSFLGQMQAIEKSSPQLFSLISEVQFVRTSATDFNVLLFPSIYKVRVRIGDAIDEHLLKYIMMVLDVVAKQGMIDSLSELDFRNGQVIYRVKEGG